MFLNVTLCYFSLCLDPTQFYSILIHVSVWIVMLYCMIPLEFCWVVIPVCLSFPSTIISYFDFEKFISNPVLHYCVAMSISIADLNVFASNPKLFCYANQTPCKILWCTNSSLMSYRFVRNPHLVPYGHMRYCFTCSDTVYSYLCWSFWLLKYSHEL